MHVNLIPGPRTTMHSETKKAIQLLFGSKLVEMDVSRTPYARHTTKRSARQKERGTTETTHHLDEKEATEFSATEIA